ncbi:hypothetical protein [Flavobacterium branchiicola]|uniref:Nucleotidyltransferase n=1 Tax=Flavobacterium branchiicola TaxID=1114875 RepID=A0ABV9PLL8_9FLAO|nr:hypothetical protein [Flavobacterium branchiicola]MBS7256329.1 hypothetical protein [Flavobacterium branchiicola]
MNLLELLGYIEKRPLMYLKNKDIDELDSFLAGYNLCLSLNKIVDKESNIFNKDFYYYILKKYEIEKGHTWLELIKQISLDENREEFDLFFEVLKDFKKDKEL